MQELCSVTNEANVSFVALMEKNRTTCDWQRVVSMNWLRILSS